MMNERSIAHSKANQSLEFDNNTIYRTQMDLYDPEPGYLIISGQLAAHRL